MFETQSDKLDREVSEMEKLQFGTPEGEVTTDPEAPTNVQGNEVAPQEVKLVTSPIEPTALVVQETKGNEDWEKRFKGLRGSRDQKLYETKQALAAAQAHTQELQRQLEETWKVVPKAPVDILEGVISDEQKEALGDTALDAMQKIGQAVTDAKTVDMEAELKALRKERGRAEEQRLKDTQASTYQLFIQRLINIVPDYSTINTDANFLAFMQVLEVDGQTRAAHFIEAEKNGNVAQVANYMLSYKSQVPTVNLLEDKITPTGQGHAPTTTTNMGASKFLTNAEIDLHYERDRKGYYKGRLDEFNRMERRIEDEWAAQH